MRFPRKPLPVLFEGTSSPLCQLHTVEGRPEEVCVQVPAAIVKRALEVAQVAAVVAGDDLLRLATAIDSCAAGPVGNNT